MEFQQSVPQFLDSLSTPINTGRSWATDPFHPCLTRVANWTPEILHLTGEARIAKGEEPIGKGKAWMENREGASYEGNGNFGGSYAGGGAKVSRKNRIGKVRLTERNYLKVVWDWEDSSKRRSGEGVIKVEFRSGWSWSKSNTVWFLQLNG